jgi:hypothetical protein
LLRVSRWVSARWSFADHAASGLVIHVSTTGNHGRCFDGSPDLASNIHIQAPRPIELIFDTRTPPNAATWTNPSRSLRQIADSRNDILAEAAGITAVGVLH